MLSIFDGKTAKIQEIVYTKKEIKKVLMTPLKESKENILFVMESTGIYHLRLAYWLCAEGFKVSVVNPLIIKRYSQMNLSRIKTDKADAKLIAEYGYEYQHKLALFQTKSQSQIAVDNLIKAIDDLIHQKTITNNQYLALKKQTHYSKDALNSYKRYIDFLKDEIKKLEKILQELLKKEFQKEYNLLKSIPGIGLKVSAMTYNPLIKQQYQRLIQNGKCKMVALIAIANKLLRQAFGVLKSGIAFDENYTKLTI